MADSDLDLAEERRLRFRIGVNLSDVIADGGDIYGDGVNIAVRLEGLAAPCGICISGTVRDHIGDRLPYAFDDIRLDAFVRAFLVRRHQARIAHHMGGEDRGETAGGGCSGHCSGGANFGAEFNLFPAKTRRFRARNHSK